LIVHGKVQRYGSGPLQMQVKDYEIVEEGEDETLHAGRLVPVYSLTQGLTQRPMRTLMKRLVDAYVLSVEEPLPEALRRRRQLPALTTALRAGHFPDTEAELAAARRRLVFDDFFLLQVGLAIRRQREGRQRGLSMNPPGTLWRRLLGSLPYRLTGAQERVWQEIRADMADAYPMNRLLQGDVGSGKTIVATLAILTAIETGYQAAFMAPTEILAEQHLMTLSALLAPLGIPVALLTNAIRGKARQSLLAATAAGEIGCVVGTHALVQEGVRFKRLGLVVVDEQHRFGVAQRATLRGKGERPDVLVMTATPIPRTLALTLSATSTSRCSTSCLRAASPSSPWRVPKPSGTRSMTSWAPRWPRGGRYTWSARSWKSPRCPTCAPPRRWRSACSATCSRPSPWGSSTAA
jgi:ATP-dependent DNA helicase RecG